MDNRTPAIVRQAPSPPAVSIRGLRDTDTTDSDTVPP